MWAIILCQPGKNALDFIRTALHICSAFTFFGPNSDAAAPHNSCFQFSECSKFLATFVPLAYPRWIVCAVSVMWVSWISSDYDNHIYLMLSDFLTMPKLPKLSTCFVCASLKTGTIVIGLLQLDASIILIIASIVAMAAPSVNMVVIC